MAPKNQNNAKMEEAVESPRPSSKDSMVDPPKPTSKMIRVLTVFAYVLSVSLTAILLSIYYIFMWEGKPHLGALVGNHGRNGTELQENINSMMQASLGPRFDRHQLLEYIVNTSEKTSTSDIPSSNIADDINSKLSTIPEETSTELFTATENLNDMNTEMQQQLTAIEVETISKHIPTTSTVTPEETITWPEEYDSLEELSRSSTFMRKIMDDDSYQE